MDWIVGDQRVVRVVQIGMRQLVAAAPQGDPKLVRWAGSSAVGRAEDVLAVLPPEVPCYVTVDLDVLDPKELPSTGTPLPGGLTLADTVALLEELCRRREVVGLDLVELLPDGNPSPVRWPPNCCCGPWTRRVPGGGPAPPRSDAASATALVPAAPLLRECIAELDQGARVELLLDRGDVVLVGPRLQAHPARDGLARQPGQQQ
ncbi:arginase family protein [Streptacidiphilus monticola]